MSLFDLPTSSCDKERLCADISILPMQQKVNEFETLNFYPFTSDKIKYFTPITCKNDELKLLSFPNTVGYIEYDSFCDLATVEKMIFLKPELLLFT